VIVILKSHFGAVYSSICVKPYWRKLYNAYHLCVCTFIFNKSSKVVARFGSNFQCRHHTLIWQINSEQSLPEESWF